MKKFALIVLVALVASIVFVACGDDDQTPCEEYAEKYENALENYCANHADCASVCSGIDVQSDEEEVECTEEENEGKQKVLDNWDVYIADQIETWDAYCAV